MLTEREQAVKNILLEEMGEMSYAERRHIEDGIDVPFLEKEAERLRKRGRRMAILSYSCAGVLLLFLVAVLVMFPHSHRFASLMIVISTMTLGISNHLACRKRVSIYRVLTALGQAESEKTVSASPEPALRR